MEKFTKSRYFLKIKFIIIEFYISCSRLYIILIFLMNCYTFNKLV